MKKQEEQKIKALIFDVGEVLFLAKAKRKRKNLLSSFLEAFLLLKNIKGNIKKPSKSIMEIYFKSSAGKISKKETLNLFSRELGVSSKEVEEAFKKVYRENTVENKELYNYILKLKGKGYKIGISSIQFHLSKGILIPKKYYMNFNGIQVSCDDGLRKPDKKAFEFVLKKLKVKAEESIFIDDKKENLVPAEKLGIKTFESIEEAKKVLK